MAYPRKAYRRRRKTYRRSSGYGRTTRRMGGYRTVGRGPRGAAMPQARVCSLSCANSGYLSSGISTTLASIGHFYIANNIHETISGTGTSPIPTSRQPLGFDQMMQFYDHFLVQQSKVNVDITVTAEGGPFAWGITLVDEPTGMLGLDVHRLMEDPRTTFCVHNGNPSGNNPRKLSKRFDMTTFFQRLPNSVGSDPLYSGAATVGPTEKAYFFLWLAPFSPTSNPPTMEYTVTTDYLVRFSEPNSNLPAS